MYTGDTQPDFNIGNAIKYLWRAGRKGDASLTQFEKTIEDLRKAIFYINDEIDLLTEKSKESAHNAQSED